MKKSNEQNKQIIHEIKTLRKIKKITPQYLSSSFIKFVGTAYSRIDEELDFLNSYLFLFVEILPFNFMDRIKQGLFSKKSIRLLTDDFLTNEIQTKIPYERQIHEFLKKKSWLELLFKYHIICLFGKFKRDIQHKITIYIVSATYEISINKIKALMEKINIRKDTITNLKVPQDLLSNLINLIQQLLILENQWKMENESNYLMKNYVIKELNNNLTDSDLRKLLLFAFQLEKDLKECFIWEQTKGFQEKITILGGEAQKFSIFVKPPKKEKNNFSDQLFHLISALSK